MVDIQEFQRDTLPLRYIILTKVRAYLPKHFGQTFCNKLYFYPIFG